jgi:Domain of unknown function (DUF5047)
MRSVSDQFLAAVRSSHVLATKVTAYPPGGSPVVLPPAATGSSVTLDRTAAHRGTCTVVIADPAFYPDTGDTGPLDVYGCEIHIERGIRFPNDTVELVSLGWYRVQTLERLTPNPGSGLTITGWDRSQQVADERFTSPVVSNSGLATDKIQALIAAVFPSAVFHITSSSETLAKSVLDRDRWPAIQQFAQAIGYEVYVDANGEWVIQPIPDPATATQVWTVDAGPNGVLVSVDDVVTRDGVPNGIVATGQPANGAAPVRGFVTDTDTTSPTLWGGPYGHVPFFYSSPFIRTGGQATAAAQGMLNTYKGASRSVNFNAAPNPALEPDDCILIVYPDGHSQKHVIDSLTIPLSVDGQITGQTRLVAFVDS